MKYHWENTGDSEVVAISDIINMPKKYLHAPWLVIDGYENSEEVIDDIVNCFDTLMNSCTGNWTTSHIPPQLQTAIKTLKDDHKNGEPWLSKSVVLS